MMLREKKRALDEIWAMWKTMPAGLDRRASE
jgi:hypothetical protein